METISFLTQLSLVSTGDCFKDWAPLEYQNLQTLKSPMACGMCLHVVHMQVFLQNTLNHF